VAKLNEGVNRSLLDLLALSHSLEPKRKIKIGKTISVQTLTIIEKTRFDISGRRINGKMFETEVLVVERRKTASMTVVHACIKGVNAPLYSRLGKRGVTILAGAGIQMDCESVCAVGFPGDPRWIKERLFKELARYCCF